MIITETNTYPTSLQLILYRYRAIQHRALYYYWFKNKYTILLMNFEMKFLWLKDVNLVCTVLC